MKVNEIMNKKDNLEINDYGRKRNNNFIDSNKKEFEKEEHAKWNRRGQEEMVGFVLIMVVVAVIFLVFLGIFVRQRGNAEQSDSTEVAQFLDAAVDITSECSLNGGFNYLTVSDLIEECARGPASCGSGEGVCTALKNILSNLTQSGWNFGAGSVTKGFNLAIYKYDVTTNSRTIIQGNDGALQTSKGICGAKVRGADKLIYTTQGTIIIEMDLCV